MNSSDFRFTAFRSSAVVHELQAFTFHFFLASFYVHGSLILSASPVSLFCVPRDLMRFAAGGSWTEASILLTLSTIQCSMEYVTAGNQWFSLTTQHCDLMHSIPLLIFYPLSLQPHFLSITNIVPHGHAEWHEPDMDMSSWVMRLIFTMCVISFCCFN